jgi:hypothetical protein
MFTVPAQSPLSKGWRGTLCRMLTRHGLHAVQDAISAYAQLRAREGEMPRGLSRREALRSARDVAILNGDAERLAWAGPALRRLDAKRLAVPA